MMTCRSKHWKSNLKSKDIPPIPMRITSANVIKRYDTKETRWMHEPEKIIHTDERKQTFWGTLIGPACFGVMLWVWFLVWWYCCG